MKTKELFYWLSLVIYGIVLTCVLLYLRFPADKFKSFCERFIEERLPEISCSIESVGYSFPRRLIFSNVRLTSENNSDTIYFADGELSLTPEWKNPLSSFYIESRAFNGNHTLNVEVDEDAGFLYVRDIKIKDGDLSSIPMLPKWLDREVEGLATVNGDMTLSLDGYRLIGGEGNLRVKDGSFGLKKEILQLQKLELEQGTLHYKVEKNRIEVSKGEVKNGQLTATFSGGVSLADPYLAGKIDMKGSLTPTPQLFKGKRQVKLMVNRMQKRYKNVSLPYKLSGTIGRPAFVFGK